MKKHLLSLMAMCFALLCAMPISAAITKEYGWFESAAIEWEPVSGASDYNVYVKAAGGTYTQLDEELVRQYPSYYRADALGLKAGTYQMKVVAVDANGDEISGSEIESGNLTVKAHDRSGFAHVGMSGGIGAYKNDGTLKDGAKVIYVWADNAKTVTTNVVTNNKGGTTAGVGLQDIVYLYQKGYETTPIAIRIIGTIKDSDMDRFDSSAEGLQVKGKNAYADMPITIEGVGEDAAIWGFGILCRNASDVEFRNFAIMLCMDDCLSLDTSNSNIWIHNMDFYYGNTGGDSDQAKGDGTVDIKGKSKNITVSYNHFVDCGKTSLGGMKSETTDCWMTYHHNWYDHSDSRHPRIRTAFYHCYNNYFDGVSKYGVGVTMGGSAFVENNYFRSTKYPMLISKQGTDAEGDGTFSGEDGGVIKAYNNKIEFEKKVQYYDGSQTDGKWDAVLVTSRDAAVNATAFTGGGSYNSSADQAARTTYIENKIDAPEDVKGVVTGSYGAGRMNHGDFKWSFNNSIQDPNYGVITDLKNALKSYKSTLVGFADGTAISNGGAASTVNGGDGVGLSDSENTSYDWGGSGSGTATVTVGKYVIGSKEDYFWFNSANATQYNAYVNDSTFFSTTGTFKPEQVVEKSDGTSCSDYIGSIRLTNNQSFTAYYPEGIVSANFYVSGNGSQEWKLETSTDGTTWKPYGSNVTGKAAGHPSCVITASKDDGIKYVRITNVNSGTRDLQGIKIATPTEQSEDAEDPEDDEPADTRSNDATAEFTLNAEDIVFSGTTYTLNVAWDADDAAGYSVAITPAENATVAAVTGATGTNPYTIAAPAAGETSTATFRILAENQANTKTYTINIIKGVDPSTIPATDGEFLYFPGGSKTYNSFYTVNGNTTNSKGSGTYVRNGETFNCDYALKLESKTTITFTPTQDGVLKIGYSGSGASNSALNGTKITETEINVTAGTTYTITKADVAYLLYLDLVYGESSDTREASEFEITSDDAVSVDVNGTSTITYINNAGTVTYESDKPSIATVSDDGVITGKADGTATITITDAGSATVKGKTITITVTVGSGSSPVETGDVLLQYGNIPEGYAVNGSTTVTQYTYNSDWTAQNLFKVSKDTEYTITLPDNAKVTKIVMYAVSDDNSSKATLASLAGTTPNTSLPVRKDNTTPATITLDNLSITGSFTFKITGKNAAVKFALTVESVTTGLNGINTVEQSNQGIIYDLMGRRILTPQKGQIYIKDGKKYIKK